MRSTVPYKAGEVPASPCKAEDELRIPVQDWRWAPYPRTRLEMSSATPYNAGGELRIPVQGWRSAPLPRTRLNMSSASPYKAGDDLHCPIQGYWRVCMPNFAFSVMFYDITNGGIAYNIHCITDYTITFKLHKSFETLFWKTLKIKCSLPPLRWWKQYCNRINTEKVIRTSKNCAIIAEIDFFK